MAAARLAAAISLSSLLALPSFNLSLLPLSSWEGEYGDTKQTRMTATVQDFHRFHPCLLLPRVGRLISAANTTIVTRNLPARASFGQSTPMAVSSVSLDHVHKCGVRKHRHLIIHHHQVPREQNGRIFCPTFFKIRRPSETLARRLHRREANESIKLSSEILYRFQHKSVKNIIHHVGAERIKLLTQGYAVQPFRTRSSCLIKSISSSAAEASDCASAIFADPFSMRDLG